MLKRRMDCLLSVHFRNIRMHISLWDLAGMGSRLALWPRKSFVMRSVAKRIAMLNSLRLTQCQLRFEARCKSFTKAIISLKSFRRCGFLIRPAPSILLEMAAFTGCRQIFCCRSSRNCLLNSKIGQWANALVRIPFQMVFEIHCHLAAIALDLRWNAIPPKYRTT